MRALLFLVAVLAGGQLFASDYTYRSGYYYRGQQAYTRSWSLLSNGCYGWLYTPYQKQYTISYKDPDYVDKLLQLKANRDKWQNDLRSSANRHNEFIEKLRELGLDGDYYRTDVGVAVIDRSHPYAIQGGYHGYAQRAAPQGSTVYGNVGLHQTEEIADVFGNIDWGPLYNSAIRLAGDSQQHGSRATSDAMSLIDKLGDRAAGVLERSLAIEETRAKAAGISQISASLSEAIKAEARVYMSRRETSGMVVPPASNELQQKIASGTLDAPADIITYRCVSCHQPGGRAAHFDLTDLSAVTDEDANKVLDRIVSSDPKKRMPPDKPLSRHETKAMFDSPEN